MKRHLIYVERSSIVTERVAMIVADEADMKRQLAAHELQLLRDFKYVAKVDRDKAGRLALNELNKDWDT